MRLPDARPAFLAATLALLLTASYAGAAEVRWVHLSSTGGSLPVPGTSTEQTGALAARFDAGPAESFVLSFRVTAPALVWYRRQAGEWKRYVIEKEFLPLEAGGAAFDIDGDGDLDIVFGGDYQDNHLWWWENPSPRFDSAIPWKRHIIKSGGANQHHDQLFADFEGSGKPQLVFWNQQAKALFLARIPFNPREIGPWPLEAIFSGKAGEEVAAAPRYAEGIDACDVDGDGRPDLLAGNSWFRYEAGKFRPVTVGTIGGRIRAGRFKPGKYPQIVIAPGDGTGPLKIYECRGNPADSASWSGRDLLGQEMIHGHTLEIGDIDGDGNLDIFAAEMAQWNKGRKADHPDAAAWILYGDGRGDFRKTILVKGQGWHEGKLADLDGDGDLDILEKPYTWQAPRVDVWLNNGTGSAK